MKALFNILLLTLLSLTLTSKLKKTKCQGLGFDCNWESKCCSGMYCVDDRCSFEDGPDTLQYTPEGERCNELHLCKKHFKCESHRCIEMNDVVIDKQIAKGKEKMENQRKYF